ncbi:MAG: adenine deaminase [Thermoflexales bacterium]|nr:adenine deaminase [Thermoflexales bacterium]
MELTRFLPIARGDEPAELVLRNGRVINVYTAEIMEADVAIADGHIVGIGSGYESRQEIDLGGRYVCPGLIDAHVHIESSMVTPYQFARAVVPRGTTTVVCDPHEIANVAGTAGIRYMLEASEGLPLTVYVNLPSCVPATTMGTAGAELSAADLQPLANLPRVLGLAELMNVPGLVLGFPDVLAKVESFRGQVIDGHAPGISGKWLQAYVGAGPGSDHECTTAAEMLEKLRLGMRVFIRESTAAKNLRALIPAITPQNSRRCAFCTDDRHPADLLDEGHLDHLIRMAVAEGLDPVTAIQMAALNAAEWFRLRDRGAIAPGLRADLVVFSDLKKFRPEMVFSAGHLVAQAGEPVGRWDEPLADDSPVRETVRVDWDRVSLRIGAPDAGARSVRVRIIGVIPDQVLTEHRVEELPVRDGEVIADPERDILTLAVIERHRGTGNVGLGFVQGLGLRRGALAGSVGHDAHNLIVAGCDDVSMMTAARAVARMGGGLAVAVEEQILATVPLPVAGLMSDQPVETVRLQMDNLTQAARSLGTALPDPLMTLSFLPLEVIPALKLTDQGLVDVEQFAFVSLFA